MNVIWKKKGMFHKIFNFFFSCWMFVIFCRIRLQEGFHFASSNSGIINMVLETDMKVRILLRGHYYSVHVYSYNLIHQGNPSFKKCFFYKVFNLWARFRNGFIILMLIVRNRIVVYRYEIWKLMSKQVKKMLSVKIDKQGNKDKNVNMEFFGKFSKY